MRRFTVGVIGNGVVGSATAQTYAEHASVRVYDSDHKRSIHFLNHVIKSDIIFICLPEASVEAFFHVTENLQVNSVFVIKSTLPIGTTKKLKS